MRQPSGAAPCARQDRPLHCSLPPPPPPLACPPAPAHVALLGRLPCLLLLAPGRLLQSAPGVRCPLALLVHSIRLLLQAVARQPRRLPGSCRCRRAAAAAGALGRIRAPLAAARPPAALVTVPVPAAGPAALPPPLRAAGGAAGPAARVWGVGLLALRRPVGRAVAPAVVAARAAAVVPAVLPGGAADTPAVRVRVGAAILPVWAAAAAPGPHVPVGQLPAVVAAVVCPVVAAVVCPLVGAVVCPLVGAVVCPLVGAARPRSRLCPGMLGWRQRRPAGSACDDARDSGAGEVAAGGAVVVSGMQCACTQGTPPADRMGPPIG